MLYGKRMKRAQRRKPRSARVWEERALAAAKRYYPGLEIPKIR